MAFLADIAFQYLEKTHSKRRMAHAYLITGPEGSGKRNLAARMIALVNGGAVSDNVEALKDEAVRIVRPESKSRRITVAQIRELEHSFHLSRSGAAMKIGVVLDADRMAQEAENAFLKTLEEPPPNCLLLLVTAAPEMLLDTILSRCIQVPLQGEDGALLRSEEAKTVADWMHRYFRNGPCTLPRSLALARHFSGYLKDVKEAIEKDFKDQLREETEAYAKTTEGDWLARREKAMEALASSLYLQRRNALVEVLVSWFGDALRQQAGYGRLDFPDYADTTRRIAETMAPEELSKRIAAAEELRELLNTNVQEILALEVSFLNAFG